MVTETTRLRARLVVVGAVLIGIVVAIVGKDRSLHRSAPPRIDSHPTPPEGPPPPAVAPVVTAAPSPLPMDPAALLDEPSLMDRVRRLQAADPAQCVELARDGNRRFPGSPYAPERTAILIHALANLGRTSEARAEAESMVNDYEDSRWVREVERFTGAHRHRNVRITEDGAVEFY